MARLFGFSIEDSEKQPPGLVSPVPPNNQDGSENYVSSGFFGFNDKKDKVPEEH